MASVSPRTARIRGIAPSEGATSYEKGDASGVAFFLDIPAFQSASRKVRAGFGRSDQKEDAF